MARLCENCRCPENEHREFGWALKPGGRLCRKFRNDAPRWRVAEPPVPLRQETRKQRTRYDGTSQPVSFGRDAVIALFYDPRSGATYVVDIGS